MSTNLQFKRKDTGEEVSLQTADGEICNHFGANVHPLEWYKQWFTAIGLPLSLGLRGEELRAQLAAGFQAERLYELIEILEFIEDNYSIFSWRSGAWKDEYTPENSNAQD